MEVWHESLTDAFNLLCGRKLSFTNYPMWEKESIKDEYAPFVGYNLTEKSCISSISYEIVKLLPTKLTSDMLPHTTGIIGDI